MKPVHVLGISIVITIGACLFLYLNLEQEKIVYLNTEEVFQSFDGTKEYKHELEQLKQQHQKVLDSLKMEVLALEKGGVGNDSLVVIQKRYYQNIYQEFLQHETEKTQEYDSKIWSQINDYIKAFGQKNKYKFIQGFSGRGNILFANEELNVSIQFIEFMNLKYAGE